LDFNLSIYHLYLNSKNGKLKTDPVNNTVGF